MNPNMLNLIEEKTSRPICSFERFEQNKAFDWLTSKDYCIVHKETIPFMVWTLRKL